jgi:hypothetical protein
VPTKGAPKTAEPAIDWIGRLIVLSAVVLLPLALFAAVLNRRRLRALRDHLNAAAVRTTLLERRLAAVAGGYAPMPLPQPATAAARPAFDAAPVRSPDVPFALYGRRRRSLRGAVGVGLVLVLVAAGAYAVVESGVFGQATKRRAHLLPTAPVVVLNGGQVPHAAHRLALTLTHRHVHVVATGNLGAPPPASYEVLYRPGGAEQARLLARLLKAQHPRIASLNPTTARAIGSTARLAVVIP